MSLQSQLLDLPLEDVMGDRFGRYSKYIIQERALPDVRDGLKPVQRRILYAMFEDKNTHDLNFRKAAKTVGTVIGNYHPHGDTSVYNAMVRLSQSWKMRFPLIEMHGNNGSIDGDPPAAMRYTEARLSSISTELLRDLSKETVDFVPNFDDETEEPVVMPARFPNLLVNGSTGISAGYATDIPPHHLGEVIDAVIKKIKKPNVSIDELMKVIKGPDFPTGGIVQGKEGIKEAFETGKGRIVIRAKTSFEKLRGQREQIVIHEIPYDVNKANLVRKIDELIIDRKVDGIAEVRDETDRTGLRIVIELKRDADRESVLNYLFKNTDLQVSYNYNMVAIVDKTPKLLSLPQLLDAYIRHQKEVITRQTNFDLKKAEERAHIVEGLIKAVSILDELIQTIRSSKNKQDAKKKIMNAFGFSEAQAEAIVMLQLYRLTNTDVKQLEKEAKQLEKDIARYTAILTSEKTLFQTMIKDLQTIQKTYDEPRRTKIEDEIEALNINIEVMIPVENVVVSVTKEGYIKRTSIRSYAASQEERLTMRDDDELIGIYHLKTTDYVLIFTNQGRYIRIPVHELPDIRWKDLGQHLSNLTSIDQGEHIVEMIPVQKDDQEGYLVFFTKQGMVKRSEFALYRSKRFSNPLIAINLRDGDEVIAVRRTDGSASMFIGTNKGYGLWFDESEVSAVGQRALGVIGIKLNEGEYVVGGHVVCEEEQPFVVLITQRGASKRMRLSDFTKGSRANRGSHMLRTLKRKPHEVVKLFLCDETQTIHFRTMEGEKHQFKPIDLAISDLQSNGSFIIDEDMSGEVTTAWIETIEEDPFAENDEKA